MGTGRSGRSGWTALGGALVAALVACAVTVATAAPAPWGAGPHPGRDGGRDGVAAAARRFLPTAADGVPPRPHPAPRAPQRFSLAAAGDVLIHLPVAAAAARFAAGSGVAYDFRPLFADIRPVVSAADVALCHLEVPLSRTTVSGYPRFAAPPALADALAWTGFDGCSTASNHAVDQGAGGIATTLEELDRVGLQHAGTARDPEEARAPTLYDAGGVTVAQVAATYGLNGLPLPPGQSWAVDLLDPAAIRREAEAARGAGAEFVVASLHWGTEYQREPTAQQRALADELLGDGVVDLVVGHHAHVVQPIGHVGDRVVLYGLGNLVSSQSAACCPAATADGMVVTVDVEEVDPGVFRARRVTYTPTWVDAGAGYRVVDVGAALRRDPADPRRRALEASWARAVEAVALGGPHPAVQPAPR